MKLPEMELTNANHWQSADEPGESPHRFVMRYELELFGDGSGMSSIDDERRELERGMILFARPGQIRHSRLPFSCFFLYFDVQPNAEFDALLNRIPSFSPPDEQRSALFERVVHSFRRGEKLLATALLLELVCALAADQPAVPPSPQRPGQAELYRAIHHMKQNLHRQLNVSELAAQAGYSPSHFTARFRELTGTTPYGYFSALRLNEAKRLLVCDGLSVSETAQQLAFASASHFCSAFHRHFGITPSEFAAHGRLSEYEINP